MNTVEVSGTLIVADPCYVPEDLRPGLTADLDVKPGRWEASIKRNTDGRVSTMTLSHIGSRGIPNELVANLGVDSGQMMMLSGDALAVWEDEEFSLVTTDGGARVEDNLEHSGRLTYNGACLATLSDDAGILSRKAFVSASGYGDGVYPCLVGRDADGVITSVQVGFISEDGGWEWEEDDDD